jgi:hypothetical protein
MVAGGQRLDLGTVVAHRDSRVHRLRRPSCSGTIYILLADRWIIGSWLCPDGLHRHRRFAGDKGSVAYHFVAFEVRSLILASLIPPLGWLRRELILSRVRGFGVFDLVCLAGQPSREPAELPETDRVFSHRPVLHSNSLSLECVGLPSCAVHASGKIRKVQVIGEYAAYRGLIRPCELMTLCHGTLPSCRRSDGLVGRCFRAMPTCLWLRRSLCSPRAAVV